jgi:hypothetical protein
MANEKNPVQLGAADGSRFAKGKKFTATNVLCVAHAAERGFWGRLDGGKLTADHVVLYSRAFVDAALASARVAS